MAEMKRSARIRKILAADPAFTNVLVGILMLFYESIWIVILYGEGKVELGTSFGWDTQIIAAGLTVILTAPFLLSSLFLASSMTDTARRIVWICSVILGLLALVFAAGVFLEVGSALKPSHLVSRLPWIAFGVFAAVRIPMLKVTTVEE